MRTTAILLLYTAALVFGTYTVFRPTFDSGFARMQADRGDSVLNHYLLENSWLAISDAKYPGTLVSPPFFYPQWWTIAYSENLFGVAPLYWLLRLGMSDELAFSWWQISLSALNFVSFAFVARWLKSSHLLALGGAYLWAFGLVHIDQLKHQQMIARFWMPLAAYHAIALVAVPSLRSLNRLFACVFLQSLACIYTGWFLVMGLAVFMPLLAWMRRGSLWQFAVANKRAVVRVCTWWGLAMLALYGPYLVINLGIGRSYDDCIKQIPTLSAWFTGPPGSRWDQTLASYRAEVTDECRLFCGFTAYAVALAVGAHLMLAKRGERPDAWYIAVAGLLTAVIWFVLTLAVTHSGDSLWVVVRHLPGGRAIRCVSRVYIVVYLFGSIGAIVWLNALIERIRRPWVRAAVIVPLVAAMIYEQTGHVPHSFERKDFYPLVNQAAEPLRGADVGYIVPRYADSKGVVASGLFGELFGMWVGLRANVPVLNGYSGRAPDGFPPMETLSDDQIRAWLRGKFRGTVRIIDSESLGTDRRVVID